MMTEAADDPLMDSVVSPWDEALVAATLFAVDPLGIGGIRVRALPGPVRERWQQFITALLPPDRPPRRVPIGISDDRLLGGLDLTATLQSGRPVARAGLLAEADGGVLLLPMAERVELGVAARLAATLDTGEVIAEREGLTLRSAARVGVIAFDEAGDDDERMAEALLDRLAIHLDLTRLGHRDAPETEADREAVAKAQQLFPAVTIPDDAVEAVVATAMALGVFSLRAPLQAVRVARAAAALDGRVTVDQDDVVMAVRLVLGPRATQMPAPPPEDDQEEPPPPEPPPEGEPPEPPPENPEQEEQPSLEEILLAAAKAAVPPGLLARLQAGGSRRRPGRAGKAGANAPTAGRGRPIGVRGGPLKPGARLNLIATLRTAAPWQRVRRQALEAALEPGRVLPPVLVRPEDFRFTRYRKRTPTTTVFVVDASGSAAMHRLAEAKGAVELLLADCYVRRDQVALVAFRGKGAELLLPPTRSLVRAKRGLAGLPGGGGTPLAAGIELAGQIAEAVAHRGETPVLVFLTDGRANVCRNGLGGRVQAQEEALKEARQVRANGFTALMVDMAPRPDEKARQIALEMDARYLPLPYADANAISVAARAVAGDSGGGPPRRAQGKG
ncbi:magnesium chelatase subunit D [Pararhodospirillum oryzae]|uniref:Mg-protoporphyrin IX chelatase n=1 Tax=Pararhodospirillum oryzae TaxID=478448 RepID=A0A512HA69_9PROT|nr:magnesium chelatase subunit D [Pararhodospirillum oryzae]GEO82346.1 Mg-protoporphyrin IX chelatase [Pararhodospirillum oryzae]